MVGLTPAGGLVRGLAAPEDGVRGSVAHEGSSAVGTDLRQTPGLS